VVAFGVGCGFVAVAVCRGLVAVTVGRGVVGVTVGVRVDVTVAVAVNVAVGVRVAVAVDVRVAVAVGAAVAPQSCRLRNASRSPARVTLSWFVDASDTVWSNPATRDPKSEGLATSTPLIAIQAAVTRSSPSLSPFWTCRTKGATAGDGTVTVAMNTSLAPRDRSYRCGPQKRWQDTVGVARG
jgi:hypothetical protein